MLKRTLSCLRSIHSTVNMSKKFKPDMHSKGASQSNIIDKVIDEHTVLPTPVKPPSDKKIYSTIQLQNGLIATLISDVTNLVDLDEESDDSVSSEYNSDYTISSDQSDEDRPSKIPPNEEKLAACSLTVQVGSFSDPENIPGLAHFLEHMVFMGSSKYPKENEFDSFINKNGGSDNATTECEYTTFYFEVQEKNLEKSLDIFSQFFKSPLMKKEAMTRERQAIESEFQLALPDDTFRKQQLLCSTANKNNPASKFTWGNEKTLKENITDDELYQSAHDFRVKHYSANKMKLAIQARLPEETLKKYIITYFSGIKNNRNPPVKFNVKNPFADDFNKLYYVESINDTYRLDLTWVMPSMLEHYRSKPLHYISSIIGDEGKGSLLSYLSTNLWAISLAAGTSDDGLSSNSIYSLFSINLFLTDLGRSHIDDVLKAIFSYLSMLRKEGPNESLFQEMKTIADIDFKYREESDAVSNVEDLSENMIYHKPEEYITGPTLYFEYNPKLISDCLNLLDHRKVNIMISAKGTQDHMILDKTEPWFQTKYSCSEIPKGWIEEWDNIQIYDYFHLPLPNNFITTDFSLLEQKATKYPEKIKSSDMLDIWYKADDKFGLPVAYVGVHMIKDVHMNCLNSVSASVFVRALKELMREKIYPATAAMYEFYFDTTDYGFSLNVYGYSQKLFLLLSEVAQGMKNFEIEITEARFYAIRESLLRGYFNANLTPSSVAKDLRINILTTLFTNVEKFNALKVLNYDTFLDFQRSLYKNIRFQFLVQGNVTKEDAISYCDGFVSYFKCSQIHVFPDVIVNELPLGEKCIRVGSFNDDKNCTTTNYYMFGPGCIKDFVTLELLLMLMEEPLFDKLRTQEQLGYDVSCRIRDTYGIIGFTISVHSQVDKYTVDDIQTKMTDFLNKFKDYVKKMPQDEFTDAVETLIKIKKVVDNHLKEEANRNWAEIKNAEYVFDRLEKEIKFISALKKKHMVQLISKILAQDFKKLTVQVVGHKKPREDIGLLSSSSFSLPVNVPKELKYEFVHHITEQQPDYFINDIYEFKKGLNQFPPHKLIK